MKALYEPEGNAGEYAPLALNLYNGCSHACEYCYAPATMRRNREDYYKNTVPVKKATIKNMISDLTELKKTDDEREVLLCFICDPYQPIDEELKLTRQAIEILSQWGRKFSILTKGGKRSERDFDLLAGCPELCRYGTTLVFAKDEDSLKYEPGAAPTSERIQSLKKAHEIGLKTWVSIEPSWSFENTEYIILQTKDFVDEYKIGKLNYHKHSKEVDWKDYKKKVVTLCNSIGVNYVLKNDLRGL